MTENPIHAIDPQMQDPIGSSRVTEFYSRDVDVNPQKWAYLSRKEFYDRIHVKISRDSDLNARLSA